MIVDKRWKDQYYREDIKQWKPLFKSKLSSEEIYKALLVLNPRTHEAVNKIIGNYSWTALTCDYCHKNVEAIVNIDVTSGEYATYICADCINEMAKLIKGLHQPAG